MELENHLVKGRAEPRANLVSYCGETFGPFPDMDSDDLTDIEYARLCSGCVKAIKAAGLVPPAYVAKAWHSI